MKKSGPHFLLTDVSHETITADKDGSTHHTSWGVLLLHDV